MSQTTMVIQETERAVSHEMRAIEGLCRTCLKAEHVHIPARSVPPGLVVRRVRGVRRAPPAQRRARGPAGAEQPGEAAEVEGLCRGCANWPTCSYPKPAGGVWHCEELA